MDTDPSPAAAPALPDGLRLGAIHLTVTDLDRSVGYYERSIGLRTLRREDREADLGVGSGALVRLHERRDARPPGRRAGLFHFALLHPSRLELSRALVRLAVTQTPIDGASDHGVSEALYLSDPDGNGIELYADRPRADWPPPTHPGERVGMFTRALDLHGLLAVAETEEPQRTASDGLVMGHMHLHVGDVVGAVGFYGGLVGFDLMTEIPSAAFLSAGGYHHHLAVNTWRGQGVGPAPDGSVGIRRWTIRLPLLEDLAALRGRMESAGAEVEDGGEDGFVFRDLWGIAAHVVAG